MLSILPPWVDGASGFVLMAGLVLGMVYRRTFAVDGAAAVRVRQLKRTLLLYLAHVGVVALALVVADMGYHGASGTDRTDFDFWRVLGWLVTLQINPKNLDILSMYVVLVALSLMWVPLLTGGKWVMVAASSAAIYIFAVWKSWGMLPDKPGGEAYCSTASWQLLYTTALIVGWHWHSLRGFAQGRTALMLSIGFGVGLGATAIVWKGSGIGDLLFQKSFCGPGRIALAWCAFVVLYQCVRCLTAKTVVRFRPIQVIGSRSLACFLALCTAVIVLPEVIRQEGTSLSAQL